MRIALSSAGSLDEQIGGGQIYVQSVAAELHRRRHNVTLIAPQASDRPLTGQAWSLSWDTWRGIRLVRFKIAPGALRPKDAWSENSAPLLAALRAAISEIQPEVLHINGHKPALASVGCELGLPHVITVHHSGVACPSGAHLTANDTLCQRPMDARWCPSCYCRQLKGGTVAGTALSHVPRLAYRTAGKALNVLPNVTYFGRTLMYPWLVERAIESKRAMLDEAQRFIAPSLIVAEMLIRNGVDPDRVEVVPHGIPPLSRMPLPSTDSRPLCFGYLGRIDRPKGVKNLFHAFSRLPQNAAELHIFGAPQRPGEQEYLDRAFESCKTRGDVTLHGKVPHESILEALASIDVLILPSICLEVFGLVVLEAFSVGRPVIVTNCCGVSELVHNGVNGIVIEPTADALFNAMADLVAHPSRVEQMSAAIGLVRTLAQHVDDLTEVYERVIEERPSTPAGIAVRG